MIWKKYFKCLALLNCFNWYFENFAAHFYPGYILHFWWASAIKLYGQSDQILMCNNFSCVCVCSHYNLFPFQQSRPHFTYHSLSFACSLIYLVNFFIYKYEFSKTTNSEIIENCEILINQNSEENIHYVITFLSPSILVCKKAKVQKSRMRKRW